MPTAVMCIPHLLTDNIAILAPSETIIPGMVKQGQREHYISQYLGPCWILIWAHQNCVHISESQGTLGLPWAQTWIAGRWASELAMSI